MARKRNKVTFAPRSQKFIGLDDAPNMKILDDAIEKVSKIEDIVKPAILISRANYPITVKYDGEDLRISPRDRVKVADISKFDKDSADSKIVIKKL